jgi:hypothetical protein
MKILLFLLFIPMIALGQAGPPPAPAPAPPAPQEDFGTTQNSIIGAQSRSFGGGSIIKPNQILNSADFTLVGSNTYEADQPAFRPGTSLSWSSINFGKGFGINAMATFDLSQQAYSFYYRHEKWYYHINFGRMGMALNTGASVTRVWEPLSEKDFTLGVQTGVGIVANGKSTDKDAYFVAVPYIVLLAQEEFKLSERITIRPEAYITMCSPYYDIGMNFFSTSSTFNAVIGNCVGIKISKKFRLNLTYRGNMNTTPKWGLMHNILIGSTLKF